MWPGKGVTGVLEHIFVELSVLGFGDLGFVFEPEGFVFVESLELVVPGLFGGGAVYGVLDIVIGEVLSLGLPLFSQGFVLVGQLFIRFLYLFFVEIFLSQINRIINKRTILLYQLLKLFISTILSRVLF